MKRNLKKTKINRRVIWIYIVITIVFLGIFGIKSLTIHKKEVQKIDENLYKAAKNLDYYITKDYHFEGMNKKSYSKEEILKVSKKITDLSNINDILYLYTIIDDNGMPTYTSIGGAGGIKENIEKEEVDELYWITFADLEDNSIGETIKIINGPEGEYFIESKDTVGSYRSIYVARRASDGRKYIIGADILISKMNSIIHEKIYLLFLNMLIVYIVFLFLISFILRYLNKIDKINEDLDKEFEFDSLTDTYKREIGLAKLQDLIEKNKDDNQIVYLWLFDIKNLSFINRELGTKCGNKAIISIVDTIKEVVRRNDIILRFDGGQFLVAIENNNLNERPEKIGEILNCELSKKKFGEKGEEGINLEVRSVLLKYKKEMTFESALRTVQDKMRNKKLIDKGRNRELELDIQRGIDEKEFLLHYQPKVNTKTRKVEFEALMRWNHKDRGLLYPDSFIKVAEESSLIFPLTTFLIKKVEKDVKLLNTTVSINISANHFNASFFLEEMLTKYGKFENIELELTEGSFLRSMNDSIEKMQILNNAGINFSIDDFGTGYSSMFVLANLPLIALKIDRSFVVNMFTSEKHMKVLKSIIELGKNLGLKVIVEGVEEKKELDKLKSLGAYVFQGYYYGKPEPLDVVLKKLETNEYFKNEILEDILEVETETKIEVKIAKNKEDKSKL